jgi:putative peptidoglycan lipid II flippase
MTDLPAFSLKRTALISGAGSVAYGMCLLLMDIVLANRYGTGPQVAIYQASYIIPALLFGVFSGGAILGAFVPIFVRLAGQSRRMEAEVFLRSSAAALLIVLTPTIILLMWVAPQLTPLITAGFEANERSEATNALRLMLPVLVPHAVAYVYCSVLVSTGRVGFANLGPLVIPLAGIATSPWWGEHNGAELIALGYLIGVILFALLAGRRVRLDGFRVTPIPPARSNEWIFFLRAYASTGVAHAVFAVLFFVSQGAAASLSAADLAVFSFGTKLILLALAFVTTIGNNVLLPHFSSLLMKNGRLQTWPSIRNFALLAFLLSSLGSLLWLLLSNWIVTLVYARGEFSNEDIVSVANVQRVFVLQAPFYLLGVFSWRMFNAINEWKPLLLAALLALLFNLSFSCNLSFLFNLSFAEWFARKFNLAEVTGITAGYSAAIALWSLILFACLRARLTAQITTSKYEDPHAYRK